MAEGSNVGRPDDESDVESDVEPATARRHPLFRLVAILVLVSFVLAWVPGIVDLLQAAFGSR